MRKLIVLLAITASIASCKKTNLERPLSCPPGFVQCPLNPAKCYDPTVNYVIDPCIVETPPADH